MNTEDEQKLLRRLALMDEATIVRWMTTFEQTRLIDAAFAHELHVVVTDEVVDIIATLRAEIDRRTLVKGGQQE